MCRYITLTLGSIFICMYCSAQIIPDSLRVDWSKAGYTGAIPNPSLVINVKDFGAYGDSLHDDYNAIKSAINSSSVLHVVFFPAGKYLISSTITLPANTILRGEGTASQLFFSVASSNCININALQTKSFTKVINGYTKGSSTLNVTSTSGFKTGSYAEIREKNGNWDNDHSSSTNYNVAQIVKVTAISGTAITISPALRIDYIDSLSPEIRPVTLKENVGIECLKITRLTPYSKSNNTINFSYTNNCWMRGVESVMSQKSHVYISSSSHISISGCYFHEAFTYDGGGNGYGVELISHSGDCKIENNIFNTLRHAMMVHEGANGNVFGYNYSFDTRSTTEVPRDAIGDIALHGFYAYANLFEGNIVQNIFVDDYWGASGPYNTFFRNRAELYGIAVLDQYNYPVKSDGQNIVANEITNLDPNKGYYLLYGSNHFTYGNNVKGVVMPDSSITLLSDKSYYLSYKPYFWDITDAWPSIGIPNTLGSGINPAKARYLAGNEYTICERDIDPLKIIVTADSIICNKSIAKVIVSASGGEAPYNGTGIYYDSAGKYTYTVIDANGAVGSFSFILGQPAAITATVFTITASVCDSSNFGGIKFSSVKGGRSPYLYSIAADTFTAGNSFQNLATGSYTPKIKDANGCIQVFSNVTVSKAAALIISISKTDAGACNNNGVITIKRSGGTSPFLYSIDGTNYSSAYVFSNLSAGTYIAYVKDAHGCIISKSATINKTTQSCNTAREKTISNALQLKAFPNPFTKNIELLPTSSGAAKVEIIITDMYGKIVAHTWQTANKIFSAGDNFSSGVYVVKAMQQNQTASLKIIKLK